jgi:hypothetical protein
MSLNVTGFLRSTFGTSSLIVTVVAFSIGIVSVQGRQIPQ